MSYELDRVSGEAFVALWIFIPWVTMEIIPLIKKKKNHESPIIIFILALIFIILLGAILSFSGVPGFPHLFFIFSLVWSFYITWIVLFLASGICKGSRREKIYLSLRNLIAFILILLTGIILKSKSTERLFGNWGPPVPFVYYISCITALGIALIVISDNDDRGKDNYSQALLKTIKKEKRIILLIVLGLFLLPRYLGPVITPWLHYKEKGHSPIRANTYRVKHDLKIMAKALEDYFADHGSYPRHILGSLHSANGFARGMEQDRLIGIPTFEIPDGSSLHTLTTPHAYLECLFRDVFSPVKGSTYSYYSFNVNDETKKSGWILWSAVEGAWGELGVSLPRYFEYPSVLFSEY